MIAGAPCRSCAARVAHDDHCYNLCCVPACDVNSYHAYDHLWLLPWQLPACCHCDALVLPPPQAGSHMIGVTTAWPWCAVGVCRGCRASTDIVRELREDGSSAAGWWLLVSNEPFVMPQRWQDGASSLRVPCCSNGVISLVWSKRFTGVACGNSEAYSAAKRAGVCATWRASALVGVLVWKLAYSGARHGAYDEGCQ
jgi:hypothetical protein